jgi:hypothetical protein
MTTELFAQLLTEAGLQPRQSPQAKGIGFSMSLHVTTEIPLQNGRILKSTRYMAGWLCYHPSEFAQMTVEQAQAQIEACKKKLERVARTKTLSY